MKTYLRLRPLRLFALTVSRPHAVQADENVRAHVSHCSASLADLPSCGLQVHQADEKEKEKEKQKHLKRPLGDGSGPVARALTAEEKELARIR